MIVLGIMLVLEVVNAWLWLLLMAVMIVVVGMMVCVWGDGGRDEVGHSHSLTHSLIHSLAHSLTQSINQSINLPQSDPPLHTCTTQSFPRSLA